MTTSSHCGRVGLTTFDTFLRTVARVGACEPAPSIGTILEGNYELVERLARGGMATVFRARDRAQGREVAIKIPDDQRDGGERLLEMFEREARITARLRHPNIVVLHHVGWHRRLPYAVLELLRGEALAQRLARTGALAPAAAIEILDGVLRALGHAHDHGVVHRDVTPRNVFLGDDGRIKLIDFGVAIDREREAGTITRGAGTRGYMPPEHHGDTDPRGDLWAAAVLFLECVTGQRPDLARSSGGRAAIRPAFPAGVSRPVRRIIKRALAREVDRRPATASEMRLALGARVERELGGTLALPGGRR
jgi:serine/threonine-protein kinase